MNDSNDPTPTTSKRSAAKREKQPLLIDAKPSEEEVIAYCMAQGLTTKDGVYLFNHWQSNGFKRSGRPILDWKAMVRSWCAGGFFPSQRNRERDERPPTIQELRERITFLRRKATDHDCARGAVKLVSKKEEYAKIKTALRKLEQQYQDAILNASMT